MAMLRHSPYHHRFVQLGAQFVERIGFAAPSVFSTTEDEHRATRERVGLFDVYYQVPIEVAGADAEAVLNQVLVADISRQPVGRVVYAAPCNAEGGMIDDLTCYRLEPDRFWLVPTPSRVDAVLATLRRAAEGRHAVVTALGYKNAYLSVQGPNSRELLQGLTESDLSTTALAYFSLKLMTLADVPMLVSRTGYSGELGYELFYPSEYAEHVLDTLLAAGRPLGVLPCGLGALRSLRIEKRYPLYGLDLDESTTPIEAGLGWTVKLTKPAFQGREVLARQKAKGTERQLVLLLMAPDAPLPPVGTAVGHSGEAVGRVTSADRGHTVGRTLAMAYVPPALAVDGQEVSIAGGATEWAAVVSTRPAYDPEGLRLRG
ncbi:aminomethyltransferase family protein [Lichenifustis flavocetrariae]|uniref:Aminomethyltransferase family protein n=1 Tax=Lichenifustis flavocetrariae TaxID=2949735 RepID=A0AA42CHN9_9HYPH|nr:aminomethyltransferase family protein [Lichenifustis flavocetrariae]MCW6507743.1 aminomethyltransferase family protein [Lichenifustis flavocetrariae]